MAYEQEPQGFITPVALTVAGAAFLAGCAGAVAVAWPETGGFAGMVRSPQLLHGLFTALVAGLLSGLITVVLSIRPAAAMFRAIEAARRMAEGDLVTRVPEVRGTAGSLGRLLNAVAASGARLLQSVRREQTRLNEQIGVLSSSSMRTRERATVALKRLAGAETALAEFDGANRSIGESVETVSSAAEETAASVAEMDASLTQVLARSEGLHRVSEEGARAAASLAEGALVLDRTLVELAGKAEDLRLASRRNEESVSSVSAAALEAAAHAARVGTDGDAGTTVVRDVRESVAAIRTSAGAVRAAVARVEGRSREIGRVLVVMEEIARQTNLLSLNATLLAGQAGEHGRGFAVLAAEIRKLSQRSTEGARSISDLIEGMRDEVNAAREAAEEETRLVAQGVKTTEKAEEALSAIVSGARRAESAVAAIRELSRAQSEAVSRAAALVSDVKGALDGIAEEGRRNTREAERIREVVARLHDLAGFVERTVQEQKGAAGQIAVAADRSLALVHQIQDAVNQQTAESQRILMLLADVAAGARETLESAAAAEDATAALEALGGSLEDEVGRFRASPAALEPA